MFTVRILAVKRPPTGVDIAKGHLPKSPYITEAELADWLGVAPSDLYTDENLTDEQFGAIVQAVMNGLEARMSENPDLEMGQFLAVTLSEFQSRLYDGVYAQTKDNPFYAIDSFLICHRFGLYPPTWVLNWLAKAFDEYMKTEGTEDEGKKDLSSFLGTKRGKGKTPILKEANSVSREGDLMNELGSLTMLEATIMEAAVMVSARQEKCGAKCPIPETLAERFTKRGWSRMFGPMKPPSSPLSSEVKRQLAETYPAHSIPAKFKLAE
ncbi:MAG: hypothetical protein IID51_09095 [Proteobacteria bacterium]|nr:hypothetical protein [Pseudomonadota bacterium]